MVKKVSLSFIYIFLGGLSVSGLVASSAAPAVSSATKRARFDLAHVEVREKYACATTDTAFKHLFDPGQAESKTLLISFVNTFIPAFRGNPVVELEAMPVSVPPLPAGNRKQTFMDLHARAKDGAHYILEMQARRHAMFDERALFYAASVYSRQISESQFQDKDWYYHLKPVIALQVLDYNTEIVRGITSGSDAVTAADQDFVKRVREHPMQDNQFMKHFCFTEKDSGQIIDYLQLLQLELPRASRIQQTASKAKGEFSLTDWWIEILCNASSYTPDAVDALVDIIPDEIRTALTRLDLRKWNPEMLKEYKEDVSDLSQYRTMVEAEKEEARKAGEATGIEKGLIERSFQIASVKINLKRSKWSSLTLEQQRQKIEELSSVSMLTQNVIQLLWDGKLDDAHAMAMQEGIPPSPTTTARPAEGHHL